MKLIDCPLTGPRPVSGFVCGGEVREMQDPARMSDADWADQIFLQNNDAGMVREWWFHGPTALWFIAERDTLTDTIVRTYAASEVFRARVEFSAGDAEK